MFDRDSITQVQKSSLGKTFIREFKSWSGFLRYAEGPSDMDTYERASRQSPFQVQGGMSFFGTRSFEEAMDLARYGWKDGLRAIKEADRKLHIAARGHRVEFRPEPDVVGEIMDIGEFVTGNPEYAWSYNAVDYVRTGGRVIDIVVNLSAAWFVSRQEIMRRGAALLLLIETLELNGHITSLSGMTSVAGRLVGELGRGRGTSLVFVPLKSPGTIYDPDRLAFALGHPSFLRRVMFSVWERESAAFRQSFGVRLDRGYGEVVDRRVDADVYVGHTSRAFVSDDSAIEWINKTIDRIETRHGKEAVRGG